MAAIASDTLQGMLQMGSDLGNFLANLAPGVGVFVLLLGVFGGIAAIVYAIVVVIKRKLHK